MSNLNDLNMDETNTTTRPVPAPRRNIAVPNPNSAPKIEYENVEIKKVADKVNLKTEKNEKGPYKQLILELNQLNEKNEINEQPKIPVPAPRNTPNEKQNKPQNYTNVEIKPQPKPSGSTKKPQNIDTPPQTSRKAPDIPDRVKNDVSSSSEKKFVPMKVPANDTSIFYDDEIDNAAHNTSEGSVVGPYNRMHRKSFTGSINSISSTTSTHSSNDNSKFKTSSPGDLLKTLGATSKKLTQSIGERVVHRTKGARHKIDKSVKQSREKLETWSSEKRMAVENSKITNVGKSLLSLKRDKTKTDSDDIANNARPQTLPVNDEMLKSISFNSPLVAKVNNFEDLSTAESSYEVPKRSYNISNTDTPPSYDDVVGAGKFSQLSLTDSDSSLNFNSSSLIFERNAPLSQSMSSTSSGHRAPPARPPPLQKNKSDSNIVKLSSTIEEVTCSSSSSESEDENIPCPKMPAPVLSREQIYGKIKNIDQTDSPPPTIPLRPQRRKKSYENVEIRPTNISSTRATIDPNDVVSEAQMPKIFSRQAAPLTSALPEKNTNRCESWSFYDTTTNDFDDRDDDNSSPEPIYENNDNRETVYGQLSQMESENSRFLLKPDILQPSTSSSALIDIDTIPKNIIDEFDPLVRQSVKKILSPGGGNNLSLLERMLGDDTYGEVAEDSVVDDATVATYSDEDNESIENLDVPTPPERVDSLAAAIDEPSTSSGHSPSSPSSRHSKDMMIIHQNMSLRSESMENLVDEEIIQANLSRVNNNINVVEPVDLSRPGQSTQGRSNWFFEESSQEEFAKHQRIDAINRNNPNNIDKVSKSIPKLSLGPPPPYHEAMGINTTIEKELPPPASPLPQNPVKNSSSVKNMFSSVFNKMDINLRRKNSIKQETRILIEMVPKPMLTQRYVRHEGHLVKFPSGVVEDILKELSPRNVVLAEKQFSAFLDPQHKQLKERFLLDYIISIQCVSTQKGSTTPDFHCFEITVALPKNHSSQNHQALSNPNMVISSNNSGNVKCQRVCHVYGIAKRTERHIWMQKIIESMTDVFPSKYTAEFSRAGWCYLKNSISSSWSGAFVLLRDRKMYFYNSSEGNLESMDLRKARCIVLKEGDDSIKNLHVEKGPMLMIDCPPFTEYLIMQSPRDTKIWRHIIREAAHNNGRSLVRQQLTKDSVPVIVDKCINFVYTHGSMSEGIYRKSGSEAAINKLLQAFRADAFTVQITRTEYNEHDIANVLKRFMRDLPERLLEKQAAGFIAIAGMKSPREKISAYRELLSRLPKIEYQTLKKLIGHLNFIQSQKTTNKMGVSNLSIVWGIAIMRQGNDEEVSYSEGDKHVVADLITLYKNLFHLTNDEIAKEQIMLSVLQKYHAAAENLSDSVKQSGDLKVWITVDANPSNTTEEKPQINVSLTPSKTVYDVCKELSKKMKIEPHKLTLSEIILTGELERPLHYSEYVLDTVLRWTAWPDADRKSNFLRVTPTKFLDQISRSVKSMSEVIPNSDLKFADTKTKSLKPYTIELIENALTIIKKEKNTIAKVKEIYLNEVVAYIGWEKKRDLSQTRWAITFIEKGFKKRSRDSPFIGHVLAGTNSNDLIVWYSHFMYNFYRNDILPNPEMIIP